MAAGDSKLFNDFVLKVNQGDYNDGDTLTLAFISNTYASVSSDAANPNLSTVTVTSGGNVNAAYNLTGVSVTRTNENIIYAANNIGTVTSNALNPTDIRCAVIYNNTSASDDLYKIYDLTADGATATPIDIVNNDLNFTFNNGELIRATNTST